MAAQKWQCFCLGFAIAGMAFSLLFVLPQSAMKREHYRAGQIDAANGVMKYELVKQDDGTTTWEIKGESHEN